MRPTRAVRSRRATLFALLLAGSLPLACVNPFKPADPELPDATCVPEEYNTPDELLNTMALAIATKSTCGANAWIHAFAESTTAGDLAYRSFYDGTVKTSWQAGTQLTAPEPWDLGYERNLHTKVREIRSTYLYGFQWSPDNNSPIDEFPSDADTGQMHRKYTLLATSPDGVLSEIIAIGFCDLSVQRKAGRWFVYRWNDRLDPAVGVNPDQTDERSMSWWRLESLNRRQ